MFRKYSKLEDFQLKEIHKILIIQQKPFGDILLNTGYLPELRRHFPQAQIDFLIQRPYLTVLEDNPTWTIWLWWRNRKAGVFITSFHKSAPPLR